MNEELLEKAKAKVKDVRLFIKGVSMRAKQLASTGKPLVAIPPNAERDWLDIALQEVAEGKVIIKAGDDDSKN